MLGEILNPPGLPVGWFQSGPRHVRYDRAASIDCPDIGCLHEGVDGDDLEDPGVLITADALTAFRAGHFGFSHDCLPRERSLSLGDMGVKPNYLIGFLA